MIFQASNTNENDFRIKKIKLFNFITPTSRISLENSKLENRIIDFLNVTLPPESQHSGSFQLISMLCTYCK